MSGVVDNEFDVVGVGFVVLVVDDYDCFVKFFDMYL